MSRSSIDSLTMTCPQCATVNNLVATAMATKSKIVCSHCKRDLGTLASLIHSLAREKLQD